MQTICPLARFKFASGAEEKIVRTFQAPVNFIENFKRLCRAGDDEHDDGLDEIIKCMRTKHVILCIFAFLILFISRLQQHQKVRPYHRWVYRIKRCSMTNPYQLQLKIAT